MIRYFCQCCGWSYMQTASASLVQSCPECQGGYFSNIPPSPRMKIVEMTTDSKTHDIHSLSRKDK